MLSQNLTILWQFQSGVKTDERKRCYSLAAALFIYEEQHSFSKMEMVSSTISVSSTPTKTCSLFLRVKTFIFFSLSLSSITFCSFFSFLFLFLIGAWFSHSLLHEKDTLLCLLGQRASECCLKSQKLSWDGIIQVSHRSCYRYYGNSQVLPSLIHYI